MITGDHLIVERYSEPHHVGMTTTSPHHQQLKQSESGCATVHDEVARAAFCLYEQQGSQGGNAVRNWMDAEAHVKAQHASTTADMLPRAEDTSGMAVH